MLQGPSPSGHPREYVTMSVAHWVPLEGGTMSVAHWVPQEGDYHVCHPLGTSGRGYNVCNSVRICFHFALISGYAQKGEDEACLSVTHAAKLEFW